MNPIIKRTYSIVHLIVQLLKSIFDNNVPLTDTIFILQKLLQSLIPIPLILNQDSKFEWHSGFQKARYFLFSFELSALTWTTGNILVHFIFLVTASHLLSLLKTSSSGGGYEASVYALTFVICLEGVVAIETLEQFANELAFVLNQLLNIAASMRIPEHLSIILFMGKLVDVGKLAVIAASAAMTLIPLGGFFIIPFLVPKEPGKLIVSTILTFLDIKLPPLVTSVLAGLLLGPVAVFGSIAVLQAIVLNMIIVLNVLDIIRASYSGSVSLLYQAAHPIGFKNPSSESPGSSKMNLKNLLISIPQAKWRLSGNLERYKQLLILIRMANTCETVYVPVLIFVGIALCITPLYVLIVLSAKVHFLIVLGCFAFLASVSIVTWFLLSIVGHLEKESEAFLRTWGKRTKTRYDHALLAAVPRTYCKIGHLGPVQRDTQLTVFNIILNYTVTVVLIE